MSDESSNDKQGKGFAGLDSMVSDVSKDVGNALKTEPTKASEPASSPTPTPPHTPALTPPAASSGEPKSTGSGNTGTGKVGWIVAGAIVLFIFLINAAQKGQHAEAPAPAAPAPYAPAPEAAAPAPEAVAPAPVSRAPAKPSKLPMEKPPIGRNAVLNVGQIRYCLAEKVRMDAYQGVINNTRESEVSRFNTLVNDYNSRCANSRYYRGDLEHAQRELESTREEITSSAKREWVRRSLGLQSPSKAQMTEAASALPKAKPKLDVSCNSDGECPANMYCDRYKCNLQVGDGETCVRNAECSGASRCVEGRCIGSDRASKAPPTRAHPTSSVSTDSLSHDERESIESACSGEKVLHGPAAYNKCLTSKLRQLRR